MTATTFPATGLPAGLTARPLARDDAAAVTALIAEQELADVGEVMIEEADIVSEWQRPSYDLSASSVGVLDGERLVGLLSITDVARALEFRRAFRR